MAEMLVMRCANGDLFTEAIGGQPRIPVWSSRAAVSRYRERYPELLTGWPAALDEKGTQLSFLCQRTYRTLISTGETNLSG